MSAGGASAGDRGKDLTRQASAARARRQAGGPVKRGQSETAYRAQAKAWSAGAVGEERTARKLERLRRHGFTTLNDVLLEPGKKWNLDHLVFGPPGIFFIDAKNWRGSITIKGSSVWRHWYAGPSSGRKSENMDREVTKIRGMATHASERLGAKVAPVLCLAGAKSRHFEGAPVVAGVTVVSMDHLYEWLSTAPVVLAPELVAMNASIAQRLFPPATPQAPAPAWIASMRS